jgi:peptidoglycan-associated lipoprotein
VQRSLAAIAALAGCLALAGCPTKPKYPECKTDDDCKEQKQVCVEGFCKECRDDTQCKEGFVCKSNACTPKPQCAKKEDCPAGQKCSTDGKCVPECAADGDCGDGQSCTDGKCGVKKLTCTGDTDCPDGSACVDGFCAAGVARKVAAPPPPPECEMKAVHFDLDKHNLKTDERAVLDEDLQCLQKLGAKKLKVDGHADERGTPEYNLALGSRRAETVKRYLKQAAPDVEIETESFGNQKPVDEGHDESAWSKNRRAELVPEK